MVGHGHAGHRQVAGDAIGHANAAVEEILASGGRTLRRMPMVHPLAGREIPGILVSWRVMLDDLMPDSALDVVVYSPGAERRQACISPVHAVWMPDMRSCVADEKTDGHGLERKDHGQRSQDASPSIGILFSRPWSIVAWTRWSKHKGD